MMGFARQGENALRNDASCVPDNCTAIDARIGPHCAF
jgi:hypothetical protein